MQERSVARPEYLVLLLLDRHLPSRFVQGKMGPAVLGLLVDFPHFHSGLWISPAVTSSSTTSRCDPMVVVLRQGSVAHSSVGGSLVRH